MPKYYDDPYLKEMHVNVVERKGDYLRFDDTIFYPGGGGQPYDRGYFYGESFMSEIVEVKRENDGIWHKIRVIEGVPGGDGIIRLDWERRYYLMKSHTAEHILYRSLENISPVKFVKVEFGIPESILFVEGEIGLDEIEKAETVANSVIEEDLDVTVEKRRIEEAGGIRMRRDRIKEEEIRVVNIGSFDSSACSGIHVKKTGEIGIVYVKRVRHSKNTEIIFMVDNQAKKFIEESKNKHRRVQHILDDFSNTPFTVFEIKRELENLKKNYYDITEKMFRFEVKNLRKINIYYTLEETGDLKAIEKRARSLIESEKCVVVMGRKSMERIQILNSTGIDFFWDAFIKENGLRGGGKNNFMMSVSREKFEKIFQEVIDRIDIFIRESPQ